MSKLRVAAIQVESHDGELAGNLSRAEPLVAGAAAAGSQLVLCPEFLAAGYIYDEAIWRSGERRGGPTESWLARLAAAHRIHIGASYLEADGDDFFNTFALAGPDGSIVGRVQKESLPAFEGWYFRSCELPKTIDTALGRIAVGICQDNHTARFMRRIADAAPDLILMPHSAPCMPVARTLVREGLTEIAPFYARELGAPVVLVNKARTFSRTPLPGVPWLRVPMAFPGLSMIVDGDASVVARAASREGTIVGDVTLDPARKRRPAVPRGYWSRPPSTMPRLAGAFLIVMERLGKRAYARNPRRVEAARAVRPSVTRPLSARAGAPTTPPTPSRPRRRRDTRSRGSRSAR
jgi:N-carbamoylputrescine amidase